MKNENIVASSEVASPGQEFALALQFLGRLHAGQYSSDAVQGAKDNPNHPIWSAIDSALRPANSVDFVESPEKFFPILIEWQVFYKEHFGMDVDLTTVKIPAKRAGFDRLIIPVRGLTLNRVYDACAKKFPCWRYVDDLDTNIPTNDRDPNRDGDYAVWFRDCAEADRGLRNLSANMLIEQKPKVKGIVLMERMLFELKYFIETGKHLDIKSVTLCSGSRLSVGRVPRARWGDDEFGVLCFSPDDRRPFLGSREAVSL